MRSRPVPTAPAHPADRTGSATIPLTRCRTPALASMRLASGSSVVVPSAPASTNRFRSARLREPPARALPSRAGCRQRDRVTVTDRFIGHKHGDIAGSVVDDLVEHARAALAQGRSAIDKDQLGALLNGELDEIRPAVVTGKCRHPGGDALVDEQLALRDQTSRDLAQPRRHIQPASTPTPARHNRTRGGAEPPPGADLQRRRGWTPPSPSALRQRLAGDAPGGPTPA